jgi:hypothetical protein
MSATDWLEPGNTGFYNQLKRTTDHLNTAEYRQLFDLDVDDGEFGRSEGDGKSETGIEEKDGLKAPRALHKTTFGKWFDDEFIPAVNKFNIAFHAWEDEGERTLAKSGALQVAREELEPKYRKLRTILKSSLAANKENFILLGLAWSDDNTPSKSGPITTNPVSVKVLVPNPTRVAVHYRDQNSDRKGRPRGCHGVEMKYAFLDHEPSSREDLIFSVFSTTSPLFLDIDISSKGKTIYYALRWEDNVGGKGPWSDYYHFTLP